MKNQVLLQRLKEHKENLLQTITCLNLSIDYLNLSIDYLNKIPREHGCKEQDNAEKVLHEFKYYILGAFGNTVLQIENEEKKDDNSL